MLHAIADVLPVRVAGERFERITNLVVRMGPHPVVRALPQSQVELLSRQHAHVPHVSPF